jgi:hypothetical protein
MDTMWVDIADARFYSVSQEQYGEYGFVIYVGSFVSASVLMVL